MPRSMSAAMLTALQAPLLQPAIFVQATFKDSTVYMWSGVGSINWNGQTWAGLGSLITLSTTEEAATVEARGITITLSGLDPTLLGDALTDVQLGLPVIVYLGLYSSGALIPTPITSWAGRIDQPTVEVGGDTAAIALACESRLLDMNIAIDRRYTLEDSQLDNPSDLGFSFVNGLQEMTLYWGKYPATGANI